ncbi:MAG: hypothetical protein IJ521_07675 [Schwartzia sp.]|nr:hypothetical protein [Schwartzia sp. (in: firmicutes)]
MIDIDLRDTEKMIELHNEVGFSLKEAAEILQSTKKMCKSLNDACCNDEDKCVYNSVERPLPVVRDEHGEIKDRTVKQHFQKINEELDELKDAVLACSKSLGDLPDSGDEEGAEWIADEAADVITAITTLEEALGIDAEARDEAQRRVNEKNRSRNRL